LKHTTYFEDNQFLEGGSLVMGKYDIYEVYKAAPNAKIISNHMEAVNHWTLSREELKSFSQEKEISDNILCWMMANLTHFNKQNRQNKILSVLFHSLRRNEPGNPRQFFNLSDYLTF